MYLNYFIDWEILKASCSSQVISLDGEELQKGETKKSEYGRTYNRIIMGQINDLFRSYL